MVLVQLPPWWKLRSRTAAPRAPLRDQTSHAGRGWWHPDIDSLSSASCPLVSLFLFFFSMFSFDLLSSHGSRSAQNLSIIASEINSRNSGICFCNGNYFSNLYLQPEIHSPNIFLSVMVSVSKSCVAVTTVRWRFQALCYQAKDELTPRKIELLQNVFAFSVRPHFCRPQSCPPEVLDSDNHPPTGGKIPATDLELGIPNTHLNITPLRQRDPKLLSTLVGRSLIDNNKTTLDTCCEESSHRQLPAMRATQN